MLKRVIFTIMFFEVSARNGAYFRKKEGYQMTGDSNPECVEPERPMSRTSCVVLCNGDQTCGSVNFRERDGCCVKNVHHLHDFGAQYTEDPEWEYYGQDTNTISNGEWSLVFKATSGTGINLWDSWTQTGTSHDQDLANLNPAQFSKYHVDQNFPYFRSHLLDTWPTGIAQVKFGLFKKGQEVVSIVFNGTGSTRDSWFVHDRLLLQPWNDLSSQSPVIFSTEGQLFRKFYITMTTALTDCDNLGWLIVLNRQANICDFDKEGPPPQFIYSTEMGGTYFKYKLYGLADVLAVFVKL